MAIVSTLLATGKASRQACQLLMLALRGSALPVLAVPIAPAAHARIPLALCSQNGQPLLGDLQVALLDVRLTQAVMETVALALQAALTLGLGGSIIGALNGMQLVKALVDDHISHLAAPATARIWAVTTISCLVELLSDPQANETSAGRDLPEVVLDCHEAVSTRAAALAFLSIATVQSEREMADHLASATLPAQKTSGPRKKVAGLRHHTAAPISQPAGLSQRHDDSTVKLPEARQIMTILGIFSHLVHNSEAAGQALLAAGLGDLLDQLWRPKISTDLLHHLLRLLTALLPICPAARAAVAAKRGSMPLLERAANLMTTVGIDTATFVLAISVLRSLAASNDGAAHLLRSPTFLAEGRRLLQSLLQSREWECGRHVLQVYVNVAASVAGQRQLLQSPAAAGFGEQLLSWVSGACPACTCQALLVLRNLAFCTENHAHFLSAPRMLPTITATLSSSSSLASIAAAVACLWTLTYHSEKVKAALRKQPDLALHLGRTTMSGQASEVMFRRLLKSCHDIVGGDNKGRADLNNWSVSPVFHHYVETLQEQLADLKELQPAKSQPDRYAEFEQQVAELEGQLKPASLPAYALPLKRSTPETAAQSSAFQQSHSPQTKASRQMPPEKLAHRMERHSPQQSAAVLDDDTKKLLGRQDQLQESLIDEMADLAASLKQNVLGMEGSVKTRGKLLEDTESALERSAAGAKQSHRQAKQQHSKGGRSFCASLMWLLLVGMVFIGMYFFIKVTSMAGYKYVKPKLTEEL
ncbi:hypothetical protein WJX84_005616 [Apatococcus fuscideae]|uniref:Vesicle transport protein USE1 n=1 Tax=Apatococcus fuscideae TaxID=2026836 RepID=A0AAW1TFQ7_9CHLO